MRQRSRLVPGSFRGAAAAVATFAAPASIAVAFATFAAVAFAAPLAAQEAVPSPAVERVAPEIIQIRHRIHANPELSNRETETAALVAERLRALGLEVEEGPPLGEEGGASLMIEEGRSRTRAPTRSSPSTPSRTCRSAGWGGSRGRPTPRATTSW